MTTIPIYQLDAFTLGTPFSGNPAAVCPLDAWLDDAVMQNIAAENNLSETAFLVAEGDGYELRWFTPKIEVPLCGHATLAAAHVVFNRLGHTGGPVAFETKSGTLLVERRDDRYVMDFPALEIEPCDTPEALTHALGAAPQETLRGMDYVAVFADARDIIALSPDFAAVQALDRTGVIATAPSTDCDFVSRFFAPAKGVDEDPVTGRAHCVLAPFWARRLDRNNLQARQLSRRGGAVDCAVAGDRVQLAGLVSMFLEGTIRL